MKVSKFVTKIVIRIFFILLFVALVPFFEGDQNKIQHIYLTFHHSWEMIFPAILIISFTCLLIYCAVKKYTEPEMNWLLVVNTIVLLAYGIAIFVRVRQMI